jgi:hypothetical protein
MPNPLAPTIVAEAVRAAPPKAGQCRSAPAPSPGAVPDLSGTPIHMSGVNHKMDARPSGWLSVRAAAETLGIPVQKMASLVRNEMVETMRFPHMRPLVSAEDLERLREQAHRPAVRRQTAEAV